MNAGDFWKRVDVRSPDECWEWQGHRNETGYGRICNSRHPIGPRSFRAHRLAYEFHHGVAPGEMHVLHSCDNRGCCNPAHLRLGDHASNMRDKAERNRSNVPKGSANALAKLTEDAVRDIRSRFQRGKYGDSSRAAREFGVSKTTIAQMLRGETWTHVQ